MILVRLAPLFAWLFVACASPGPATEQSERGALGKADGVGSCENKCGGKSDGTCWCDSSCAQYGDCCDDSFPMCGIGQPPPPPPPPPAGATCEGKCGGKGVDGTCWCDTACLQNGDCCADYEMECLACPSMAGCNLNCSNGFVQDAAGCDTCACVPAPPPPPPPGGTCEGACGAKSADGTCWCDDGCAQYGDCCSDKVDVCERQPFAGQCLINAGDGCVTDDDCQIGGCTGTLCYNPAQSAGITTCQGCDVGLDPEPDGCGCVAGKCSWWN